MTEIGGVFTGEGPRVQPTSRIKKKKKASIIPFVSSSIELLIIFFSQTCFVIEK